MAMARGGVSFADKPAPPVYSTISTRGPFDTISASSLASQLVSLMQPWDSVLLINEGSGVP